MFVKICGITNEEDALLAVALGADCIGFNFVPGSPRQISPNDADSIRRRLPHGTVSVGVFKNEAPEKIVSIVTQCGLSGAQLHGREPISEVRWIRKRLPFVIQAFAADDNHLSSAGDSPADIILIDAATPGSGRVFDWRLASNAPGNKRILIAGGLTPNNIVEAIEQLKPYGVDVATGVESAPGKKDAKKMQKFIDLAQGFSEQAISQAKGEHSVSSGARAGSMDSPLTTNIDTPSRTALSQDEPHAIYDWMDDGQ